jgi:hypothetical protein
MKIDCLMGTYGRYSMACEALASFLQQTVMSQATLLVYNQHPVPLTCDHPRVRVINEDPPAGSLRFIRRRMLDLADSSADLIHFWDDDDLYLPWHLEGCLKHVGDHVAWKPKSSWIWDGSQDSFSRLSNRFEGSWVFRADFLQRAPIDTHPTYTDHPVYLQVEDAGSLGTHELGGATSYIYRWANGAQHLSGYGVGTEAVQLQYVASWRSRSNDVRDDGQLIPADLRPHWRTYLAGIEQAVTAEELEWIRQRLPV